MLGSSQGPSLVHSKFFHCWDGDCHCFTLCRCECLWLSNNVPASIIYLIGFNSAVTVAAALRCSKMISISLAQTILKMLVKYVSQYQKNEYASNANWFILSNKQIYNRYNAFVGLGLSWLVVLERTKRLSIMDNLFRHTPVNRHQAIVKYLVNDKGCSYKSLTGIISSLIMLFCSEKQLISDWLLSNIWDRSHGKTLIHLTTVRLMSFRLWRFT